MALKHLLLNTYDKHYKKLMLFSLIVLILSAAVLVWSKVSTGEFFQKGVSLKGGLTVTIPVSTHVAIGQLEAGLEKAFPKADISVRELTEGGRPKAIIVEASDVVEKDLLAELSSKGIQLVQGEYSVESMGSSLGASFFKQTMKAILIAFIAMAFVVLLTFKSLFPASFVVLCAFSDMVSTLAVVSLLGIKLSTAGIAAFLMLIGYSVDTDILLTTKVFKQRREGGTVFERTVSVLKTGLTMSLTTLAATLVAYFFSDSETIKQIALIIAVGMIFDMIYTWFQNAGILRWYLERKHGQT